MATGLTPSLDTSGRNAVIAAGGAVVRAFYKPVSALTSTPIPAASSQNRLDRLVLRLDRAATLGPDLVKPVVITGTPSSSPALPALTQTPDGLYDLPISHWTSASTGALTGLVDERAFIGGPVMSGPAAARPAAPDRNIVWIDTGTGNVLAYNGSWVTVYSTPDSWHHAPAGANGWSANTPPDTYFDYRLVSAGMVGYTFRITPGATDDGTRVLRDALESAYWPPDFKRLPAATDRVRVSPDGSHPEGTSIVVHADGTVSCDGVAASATLLMGSGAYFTDSPN